MASRGLLPAYNVPTHGKTSLDHVILKTKLNGTTLVIESMVTDHSAVMFHIRISTAIKTKTKIDFIELGQLH